MIPTDKFIPAGLLECGFLNNRNVPRISIADCQRLGFAFDQPKYDEHVDVLHVIEKNWPRLGNRLVGSVVDALQEKKVFRIFGGHPNKVNK